MKFNSTRHSIQAGLIIASLAVLPLAHASGSNEWKGSTNNTSEGLSYDLGKKVFQEKVICGSCPYADMELTAQAVSPVVDELGFFGDIGKNLSYDERRSVRYFIKKRFNI